MSSILPQPPLSLPLLHIHDSDTLCVTYEGFGLGVVSCDKSNTESDVSQLHGPVCLHSSDKISVGRFINIIFIKITKFMLIANSSHRFVLVVMCFLNSMSFLIG